MIRYNLDLVNNPSFNTVLGLTNTTFSPTEYVEDRMATEQQISELYQDIVAAEQQRDYCCRDIIVWEAHVQIVRMNSNTVNSNNNLLSSGGAVISNFDENVTIGTMRRGLSYTIIFPMKWDNTLYTSRNVASYDSANCIAYSQDDDTQNNNRKIVNYRLVEDDHIGVANCQATRNNYARFWYGSGLALTTSLNNNRQGYIINSRNNWGNFVHDIKDDGTVTITDHRRNTNYNIIRFYTQWILRRCADGSIIPEPE